MSNPFSSPDTLDVRHRSAGQIRSGDELANLGNGPVVDSHGTPARLIAWPGTGFQTEAVHVLTLESGHEGNRYQYDMAEEAFLCHSGKAEVWLRDQWVSLEPGDIAYIPEGAERAVRNTGDAESNLHTSDGKDTWLGGFASPPQLDLLMPTDFYEDGRFSSPEATRLEIERD